MQGVDLITIYERNEVALDVVMSGHGVDTDRTRGLGVYNLLLLSLLVTGSSNPR